MLTVHDLAADWSHPAAESFQLVGGRVTWEQASYGRGDQVKISRLVVTADGIRQVNRYVDPATPVKEPV
jgi:hypothetical protein